MKLPVIYADRHAEHDPQNFILRGVLTRCPEQPERAERLHAALGRAGALVEAPTEHGLGPVAAVHTSDYLDFLKTAHRRWQDLPNPSPEVLPNVHPSRLPPTRPEHVIGQAGYHMADGACPIGAGTWAAALQSADAALTAADRVLNGSSSAYALCRPPGHHAGADVAGGFCYLNNVAIAAQAMTERWPRMAILDIDVHHGNGTQSIFYDRADVFFASVHGDPDGFYPFLNGYAHEKGAGAGAGYNLNLPLSPGTGDAGYLEAIGVALQAVETYAPGALAVSLGLDAQANDPLGILKVSTDGFRLAGERIGRLEIPILLVQEGGYLCDELADNLVAFLEGFDAAHHAAYGH
ncbi:MAG: histone deacetylase family protein [Alphaproteobacteria bacterium]